MTNRVSAKAKKFFLFDSIGAFLTSFLLLIILKSFSDYFGMPEWVLTVLGIIAFGFSVYSAFCYLLIKNKHAAFLKGIAIANILYCFATVTLLIAFQYHVTALGVIYFIGEIITIPTLAIIELNTAKTLL